MKDNNKNRNRTWVEINFNTSKQEQEQYNENKDKNKNINYLQNVFDHETFFVSGTAGFRTSDAVHLRKEGGHVLLLEARADHLANIKSDEGHRPEVALDGIRRKIHNYFHRQRKMTEVVQKSNRRMNQVKQNSHHRSCKIWRRRIRIRKG